MNCCGLREVLILKYLNDKGVSIWDEWADDNGELGPTYGTSGDHDKY